MEKDGFGFAAAWTELVGSWELQMGVSLWMLMKLLSWGRRPGLDFRGLLAVTHRRRILGDILVRGGVANGTRDNITA